MAQTDQADGLSGSDMQHQYNEGADSAMYGDDDGEQDMDEDSESDIDIITERPEGEESKAAPRHASIRNLTPQQGGPQSTLPPSTSTQAPPRSPQSALSQDRTPATTDTSAKPSRFPPTQPPYPPYHPPNPLDLSAKPIYAPLQKPLHELDIDKDFAEEAKLWRRPGTDLSDYFNYGFDEFTWSAYNKRQTEVRKDFDPKRMMEEMQQMTQQLMGPGQPGQGPGAQMQQAQQQQQQQQQQQMPGGAMPPGMLPPGMDGMPPEMQAMMAQMMAGGGDISQMDPQQFAQMMGGSQAFGAGFDQGVGNQRDNSGGGRGGYGRGRGRRNW